MAPARTIALAIGFAFASASFGALGSVCSGDSRYTRYADTGGSRFSPLRACCVATAAARKYRCLIIHGWQGVAAGAVFKAGFHAAALAAVCRLPRVTWSTRGLAALLSSEAVLP